MKTSILSLTKSDEYVIFDEQTFEVYAKAEKEPDTEAFDIIQDEELNDFVSNEMKHIVNNAQALKIVQINNLCLEHNEQGNKFYVVPDQPIVCYSND